MLPYCPLYCFIDLAPFNNIAVCCSLVRPARNRNISSNHRSKTVVARIIVAVAAAVVVVMAVLL